MLNINLNSLNPKKEIEFQNDKDFKDLETIQKENGELYKRIYSLENQLNDLNIKVIRSK